MAVNTRIYTMPFSTVYPLYVQKAERKGRTKAEVDQILFWLTGYDAPGLQQQLDRGATTTAFFDESPRLNPNREKITGVVCGYRVEEIEDPLMRQIRQLDKMIDELAKGKLMDKILRG